MSLKYFHFNSYFFIANYLLSGLSQTIHTSKVRVNNCQTSTRPARHYGALDLVISLETVSFTSLQICTLIPDYGKVKGSFYENFH